MAVEDSVAQDQIRAFVERIERMEEEKKALSDDIREIYAEAKGNGFDVKILRRVVGIRKQDANERLEQEAILELYMSALGMVAAPPEYNDERERLNSMASRVNSALSKPATTTQPQPTKAAGIDLAASPALSGQVADIPDIGTPISNEAPMAVDGDSAEVATAPLSESVDILPGGDMAETLDGADQPPAAPIPDADKSVEAPASAAPVPTDPLPGEVYWENTPRRPAKRHEYSAAFGTLGQDIHVITEDIAKAQSAAIVMMGDTILDGWARFMVARGMVGMDGQTTDYPAYQYDGTDPLLDCIRWNLEGRILDVNQRQIIAKRLIEKEPKRKADIIKAFGFAMEAAA